MEPIETIEEVAEAPNYDTSFVEDDYQRYYIYKNEKQGEVKNQVGVCRKCGKSIERKNGSTNGMIKHSRGCDPNAWECLNKRKSRSASLSPSRNKVNSITQFFEVNNLFLIYNSFFSRSKSGRRKVLIRWNRISIFSNSLASIDFQSLL